MRSYLKIAILLVFLTLVVLLLSSPTNPNIVAQNACVMGDANGGKQDDRSESTPRWRLANLNVHNNTWSGGRCGLDIGGTVGGNLVFANNTPKCEGEQ